jgi:L-asparaginase
MTRARARIGKVTGEKEQPVALFWIALDEPGFLLEAMLDHRDQLGYRGVVLGAMGGGHVPERIAPLVGQLAGVLPTVVAARAGAGGPMLRHTYGGPSSEIALRNEGLIWGGRLQPLKARVLLETCLRAGLDRAAIAEVFDAWG